MLWTPKSRPSLIGSQVIISLDTIRLIGRHEQSNATVAKSKSFSWTQLQQGNQSIFPNSVNISPLGADSLRIRIEQILTLKLSRRRLQSNHHRYMYLDFEKIHKFWTSPLGSLQIATTHELKGLLGDSGFLESLHMADLSSSLDNSPVDSFGCNPVIWYSNGRRLSLCRCQLAQLNNGPFEFAQEIRIQACCDRWLARALEEKKEGNLHKHHITPEVLSLALVFFQSFQITLFGMIGIKTRAGPMLILSYVYLLHFCSTFTAWSAKANLFQR